MLKGNILAASICAVILLCLGVQGIFVILYWTIAVTSIIAGLGVSRLFHPTPPRDDRDMLIFAWIITIFVVAFCHLVLVMKLWD